MKVLIAPLNWGLGHATRCAALVYRHLQQGDEVVLGGDGDSLTWLKHEFPQLRSIPFAPLRLHYSKSDTQIWTLLCAIPKVLWAAWWDRRLLNMLLREEHFDLVISDNRFGFHSRLCRSVYLTHQLHICLPKSWRWLSPLADRIHRFICSKYDEVWVPDYEDTNHSLAGQLSHTKISNLKSQISNLKYLGPLSRFSYSPKDNLTGEADQHEIVAVLSGLEPQRTLFEQQIIERFHGSNQSVLIVRGKPAQPFVRTVRDNITLVPWLKDAELVYALKHAKHIIARSGYTTIMDLHILGLLNPKSPITNHHSPIIDLIPTPGQSEQEYLASLYNRPSE